MIQLSEREAEAFFAKINRPMPRDPAIIHQEATKAVAEALACFRPRRRAKAAVAPRSVPKPIPVAPRPLELKVSVHDRW